MLKSTAPIDLIQYHKYASVNSFVSDMRESRFTKLPVLLVAVSIVFASCNNGCMICSGVTADREICEDDYIQNGDFEDEIAAYEAAGGVCNEK